LRAAAACSITFLGLLFLAQRPLTAALSDKVAMADMTWVEVRTAIDNGYATAIVPTGGVEQNGVHMVLGKHDQIVQATARRIASELGQTLVTPVVSFVPQGDFEPPTGNLRLPGTLGVTAEAFGATLDGIARGLKAAGFKTICLVGDHGGSQGVQAEVAQRLTAEWPAPACGLCT
jgi:creatinine amidohydrolase/Fe(II)-dependent formamide hydrolase-like protein